MTPHHGKLSAAMAALALLLPAVAPLPLLAAPPEPQAPPGISASRPFKSGKTIRYTAKIRMPCRDAQVYRITKRWASKGGVIRSVGNIVGGRNGWIQSSNGQRGLFSYPVRHNPGIPSYATRIIFRTNRGANGQIAVAITFHVRSRSCGKRLITKRGLVTVRP